MFISDELRAAMRENATTGTAFLHAPKAGGTSLRSVELRRVVTVVEYDRLRWMHRIGCQCREPRCLDARRHEAAALRSLTPGRPWLLQLGHFRLSVLEAADIPEPMRIIIPIRDNLERVQSLLRYDVLEYERGRRLRALMTPRHTLAFCGIVEPDGRRVLTRDADRRRVVHLLEMARLMEAFVEADGVTFRWRAWADSALRENPHLAFWYSDLVPALRDTDDPRWRRIAWIPVAGLDRWIDDEYGVRLPRHNTSDRLVTRIDVRAAVDALAAAFDDYGRVDDDILRLLSADANVDAER